MLNANELTNNNSGHNSGSTPIARSQTVYVDTEPAPLYNQDDVDTLIEVKARALARGMCLQQAFLENYTGHVDMLSTEDSMKAIDRRVNIGGNTYRIRAANEQEYAEKVFHIMSGGGLTGVMEPKQQGHDFKEYASHWFETFSKPNVETATAKTYERQLRLYWIPAFEGKNVEDITAGDIQAVFNSMSNTAKETKQKAKVVINMVFQQAIEDEIIKRNPVSSRSIRLAGRGGKETKPYTVEQMRYMVSHLDSIKNDTDRAYMALATLHPLRLEEILGLTFGDIDRDAGVIHVCRSVTHPDRNQPEVKETKTDASRRDIAFALPAMKYLPEGAPNDYVIGCSKPFSYSQVRKMRNRIKKDIGFDEDITPRRFRTTVLTDIYDTTKDIKQAQAAADHTTPAMTLRYYVKGRNSTMDTASHVASLYGLG